MAKKKAKKKITTIREHPLHVPVSKKNPAGITIRDQHLRRLPGTYLKREEIVETFKKYGKRDIPYPTSGKISEHKSADKHDELIAVWTDYFNSKLKAQPPLNPDVFKALVASESGFRSETPENKIAFGITQITKQTLAILQDPRGEAKDFIFSDVRQKDLKNPEIAIPLGIRWLIYKSKRAAAKLGRQPTHEDIILEYKGLLKSKTQYKDKALGSYRYYYELLKKSRMLGNVLACIILVGCTTSSFRTLNQRNSAIEFLVTPDRVILECEKVETDDRGIVYGFMMHVLDEEKTSFSLVQTNTLDKESCDIRIKKIGKILSTGSQIYIVGIGNFREAKKVGLRKHSFPSLGSFEDNGRSLQFIAIKNERNQCFGAFSGEEQPCPPEPFPIRN